MGLPSFRTFICNSSVKFINPISHGLFWYPHIPRGGAKVPPLSKIVPENTCKPKSDQNVVQLFYFWVPSKKFRWRRYFCLCQHFLGHNWHFSGKNTLFTKYIIKIQHEIRLTCMTPHFLGIELYISKIIFLERFKGSMTS